MSDTFDESPNLATELKAWHAAEHVRMEEGSPADEAPAGTLAHALREWHKVEHAGQG